MPAFNANSFRRMDAGAKARAAELERAGSAPKR